MSYDNQFTDDMVRRAEADRDELIRKVIPKLGTLPSSMNREGRRILKAKTKGLNREEKEGVYTYVASRLWTGPLTSAELAFHEKFVPEASEDDVWFHGGMPGRQEGDLLLPPSVTGEDPRNIGKQIPDRLNWVYLTMAEEIAYAYAAKCPDGTIYMVEPQGELRVDPIDLRVAMLLEKDYCSAYTAFCASSAKVVKVLGLDHGAA